MRNFLVTMLLILTSQSLYAQSDKQDKWNAEAEASTASFKTMFTVQGTVVDGNGCRMILFANDVTYVVRCVKPYWNTGEELQGTVTSVSGRMVVKFLGGGFLRPGSSVVHYESKDEIRGPWRYNVVTLSVLRTIE